MNNYRWDNFVKDLSVTHVLNKHYALYTEMMLAMPYQQSFLIL